MTQVKVWVSESNTLGLLPGIGSLLLFVGPARRQTEIHCADNNAGMWDLRLWEEEIIGRGEGERRRKEQQQSLNHITSVLNPSKH